ncbi:MAG: hypothetical protein Q8Q31_01860 [Nanoarchaeota archaeon]|nr:hypothetical protein [Nanoarchaeota archaeon]
MQKEAILVIFLGIFILLMSNVDAAFTYYNSTVQKDYYGGDHISGAINISFANEPANSIIKSNFGGNITLIDWINNNSLSYDIDYTCSTNNCKEDYIEGPRNDSLPLKANETKVIGLKIVGRSINIEDFNLRVQSQALPTCDSPLTIKIAGKEDYIIQSKGYTSTPCGAPIFGCFNNRSTGVAAQIRSRPYCANITLPPAPAFEVGAVVSGAGQGSLTMWLYNKGKEFVGKCDLPVPSQPTSQVKCIINHTSAYQENYHVCISDETDSGAYSIKLETAGPNCGSNGIDSDEYVADYEIYGRPMQFRSADISINQTLFDTIGTYETLSGYLQNYLLDIYKGNCTQGCFLPFEIESKIFQNLTLSNNLVRYSSDVGSFSTGEVYLLDKQAAKINMISKILSLDKLRFFIPTNSKEKNFILYISNREILRKTDLNITPSFDFDISPKRIVIAQETELKIIARTNITSSSWKFLGEAENQVTDYKIKKTFYDEGKFEIEVKAINKSGAVAKKKFEIEVGDARSSANHLIEIYQEDINQIYSNMRSYPPWIASQVEKKAQLNLTNLTLSLIKKRLNESAPENYSDIVREILNLDSPESIIIGKSWQNIPVDLAALEIDTSYIEKISNRSVSDKDALKGEILKWMKDNYNGKMSSDVISLKTKKQSSVLFTTFNITLLSKNNSNIENYFIIDYPQEVIVFSKDYGQLRVFSEEGEGVAIPLQRLNTLEFIILEEIEPTELKSYISPNLDVIRPVLDAIEDEINGNPRKSKAFYLYLLTIIGFFIVYIICQEWYKRYYESHLFVNKDDLYNIITFIHNSRMDGTEDLKVKNKLEDSGWSREQTAFAFKKIDGKRTGMFEIPLFSFFEKRKVINEINKRKQLNKPEGPGARFIKRP